MVDRLYEHKGGEFFENENIKIENRETFEELEKEEAEKRKLAEAKEKEEAQKRWMDIDNPYLWDGDIDLDD